MWFVEGPKYNRVDVHGWVLLTYQVGWGVGACFGSEEVFSQTAGIQTVYIGTKKREKSTQLKQDNEELFQNKTDFFGNSTFFAVHD